MAKKRMKISKETLSQFKWKTLCAHYNFGNGVIHTESGPIGGFNVHDSYLHNGWYKVKLNITWPNGVQIEDYKWTCLRNAYPEEPVDCTNQPEN